MYCTLLRTPAGSTMSECGCVTVLEAALRSVADAVKES